MLESILQDSHYLIIATRDGQGNALILVQTQRDADWSVQRLNKENYADKYHIKKSMILKVRLKTTFMIIYLTF
ncbi:hypothetical protein AB6H14_18480 [Providencia vermicola]